MNEKTRKIVLTGMFCAIAYVLTALLRIPISPLPFLKYDPKDFIIAIGGFILGPIYAFIITFIVAFFEMITVSDTELVGFFMNVVSSSAFVCTAAFIYKRKHSIKGAVVGLAIGCLAMTGIMLLWNYIITPGYQGVPRQVIADMLIPYFLPFNLIKSGINASITVIVYKPLMNALRKSGILSGMLPVVKKTDIELHNSNKINIGILLLALFILVTCIMFVLSIKGII